MAIFHYNAYTPAGEPTEGTVVARDRSDAAHQLSLRHLQPVSLKPLEAASTSARPHARAKPAQSEIRGKPSPDKLGGTNHLKPSEVLLFVEELAQLLKGGIQLEPALAIMERRKELSGLKQVAGEVRSRIRDGQSFSNAIRNTSPSFGDMFCNLVTAGELSGSLPSVLFRQARYLKSIQQLKSRVLFALIYPSFLLVSAAAVGVLFVVFLIPKLVELLDSTGGTLPAAAQTILALAHFFQHTWWIWLSTFLASFALLRRWSRKEENGRAWDHFLLRIPLAGSLIRERFYVQFLETLCNLLSNGLPLNRSLELARAASSDRFLRRCLDDVVLEVADGTPLSSALERTGEFPSLLIDMVTVGEQTGELSAALGRTAERYDEELRKRAEKLSAIIQPAVVVAMAGMVGAMAYLMVTAIFQTISGLNS